MMLPTDERLPSPREPRTANERFRDGDRGRFYRCAALSALAHALLVLASPELTPPAAEAGGPSGASPLELVALGPAEPPGAGLVAVPLPPEEDESAPGGAEEDREARDASDDGGSGSSADGSDRRAEALERLAAVRPGVLGRHRPRRAPPARRVPEPPDPVPETSAGEERSDADEREGDEVRIPGATSHLEARLSEEERMRLERLSSLRPGLAFGSLSDWLVVRNPRRVSRFMRKRFPRTPDGKPGGTLSVSLWVDERGSVEWAEIHRSSGRPDLDASALELFEEVIAFAPARELRRHVPTAAIFWLTW